MAQSQKNMLRTTKNNNKIQKATAASLHEPAPRLKISRKQKELIKTYGYNLLIQPTKE